MINTLEHNSGGAELKAFKEAKDSLESENMNSSHHIGISEEVEPNIFNSIARNKQPRVKRRPALDTNLSRST